MSYLEFTLSLALAIMCVVSSILCFGMLASDATRDWLQSVRLMIWIISGVCLLQTLPVMQLIHEGKPLGGSDLYLVVTTLIGRVAGAILCSSVILNYWHESEAGPSKAMAHDLRLTSKKASA